MHRHDDDAKETATTPTSTSSNEPNATTTSEIAAAEGSPSGNEQPTATEEKASKGDGTVAGFNSQTNYLPRKQIIIVFLAVASVIFTILLDQTTLAVSAPIIGSDLNAGTRTSFIQDGYFITATAFQLIYGRVSDFCGRKPLLLCLTVVFFIGSLGSSLSPDVISLSIFRAITGIAGGGVITISQVIISDVVSLRERGKYQGVLGTVIMLGNGLGPLVGGALAQKASWRDQYRLMLPLSAVAGATAWRFLPFKKVQGDWKRKAQAIDWTGAVLTLTSTLLIVLGLSWAGGSYPWSDAHVLAPLIIGIAVAIVFLLWQWKGCTESRPPLMPLSMFNNSIVVGCAITQVVNGWAMYSQIYFLPQLYQLSYGYTPILAAALTVPMLAIQSVSSVASGFIVSRTGRYRELLLLGWACWSIGAGLISTLDQSSGKGKQIGYALLTGIGVGQTLQVALVALQGAVPRSQMAVVTSMRNFTRQLGGALGLAVGSSIVSTTAIHDLEPLGWSQQLIKKALDDPAQVYSPNSEIQLNPTQIQQLRAAYLRGFHIEFYLLASLTAFAFFVTLALLRQKTIDREDDAELKAQGKQEVRAAKEAKASKKMEAQGAGRDKSTVPSSRATSRRGSASGAEDGERGREEQSRA